MAGIQPSGKGSSGSRVKSVPATVWNNMVSAGQAWSDQQLGNQSGSVTRDRSTDSIKAKNTTSDRRRGEILGEFTTGLLTEITPEHIWLNGTTPTNGKSFGILKYPCKADDIAACQVSGVCIAWVNVTDAAHNYADVTTGNFVLQSADSGPIEILGNPGVGELECAVRFAPVSSAVGSIIEFEIIASSASTEARDLCSERLYDAPTFATARVISRPCGVAHVEQEVNGTVVVHDRGGKFLFEREAIDLDGKIGFATLMGASEDSSASSSVEPCQWVITYIDWFRWVQMQKSWRIVNDTVVIEYMNVKVWDHCILPDEIIQGTDCIPPTSSSSSV